MLRDRIHIKKAKLKDLEINKNIILNLVRDSMTFSFPDIIVTNRELESRYKKLIDYFQKNKASVLIAEKENKLIGYLWYFIINEDRIHINQIVISEEERGKGIGTKLLKRLYQEAIENKLSEIELNVTHSNKKAIEFYKKEKFEEERILLKRDVNV